MLEAGVFQLLSTNAALQALIADRVFFVKMPAKETLLPAVVFQIITTRTVYSATGPSGFRFVHVQFDSYAEAYSDAVAISRLLRTALAAFVGPLPDGTLIHGSIVMNEMDMPYEPGTSGYVFRRLLEIEFQQIDN